METGVEHAQENAFLNGDVSKDVNGEEEQKKDNAENGVTPAATAEITD